MENDCEKCKGKAETECCECGEMRRCPECDGEGTTPCCIADWEIPKNLKNYDLLEALQEDALKCREDHARLIWLNPKAKESYDKQLSETLHTLNEEAKTLL